jgi:arylsulfatase A-like enzyme
MYGGFEQIQSDRTLVSEPLSAAGYRTAGFHSNPYLSADFGYDKGWDQFFEGSETESLLARLRGYARDRLDDDGLIYKTLKKLYDGTERQTGIEVGSMYVTADDLTDQAIAWSNEVTDSDDSRFLWIHYMDVHHPYVPPTEHQLAFRDEPISDRRSIKLRRKMLEQPADVTDTELADIIDLYDAEIRFVDSEISRLVESGHLCGPLEFDPSFTVTQSIQLVERDDEFVL